MKTLVSPLRAVGSLGELNMNKKFQVFISSTYEDLIEERKSVEETIIRSGDIPVGMEAFPAADDEQFEFIKTIIDACDYYVLIIAGRYGSTSEDGVSYTEKEFHYAAQKSIPILVFVHADIGSLASKKSEKTDDGREKLKSFIETASAKRIRKTWSTPDGLKLAVREALDYAKATKPRPGWIRGDLAPSEELIRDNLALREENAKLRAAQPSRAVDLGFEPVGLNAEFTLRGTKAVPSVSDYGVTFAEEQAWSQTVVLEKLFAFIAPNMRGDYIHNSLNNRMAIAALGMPESALPYADRAAVDPDDFNSVLLQLEALGLIATSRKKTSNGSNADFSSLTDLGTRTMLKLRVLGQNA